MKCDLGNRSEIVIRHRQRDLPSDGMSACVSPRKFLDGTLRPSSIHETLKQEEVVFFTVNPCLFDDINPCLLHALKQLFRTHIGKQLHEVLLVLIIMNNKLVYRKNVGGIVLTSKHQLIVITTADG